MLSAVLPAKRRHVADHHDLLLDDTLAVILEEAAAEGIIEESVAASPDVRRLIRSCLTASHGVDPDTIELHRLVAQTQAFLRAAVGARTS